VEKFRRIEAHSRRIFTIIEYGKFFTHKQANIKQNNAKNTS